jgi:hypothetical protein
LGSSFDANTSGGHWLRFSCPLLTNEAEIRRDHTQPHGQAGAVDRVQADVAAQQRIKSASQYLFLKLKKADTFL